MIASVNRYIIYRVHTYRVRQCDPGTADGLQIQPQSALAALLVETRTSPAHAAPNPGKRAQPFHVTHAKFITSFKPEKGKTQTVF